MGIHGLAPQRRDRGHLHRRSHGRARHRTSEDGRALPWRARGEVQPAPPDRREPRRALPCTRDAMPSCGPGSPSDGNPQGLRCEHSFSPTSTATGPRWKPWPPCPTTPSCAWGTSSVTARSQASACAGCRRATRRSCRATTTGPWPTVSPPLPARLRVARRRHPAHCSPPAHRRGDGLPPSPSAHLRSGPRREAGRSAARSSSRSALQLPRARPRQVADGASRHRGRPRSRRSHSSPVPLPVRRCARPQSRQPRTAEGRRPPRGLRGHRGRRSEARAGQLPGGTDGRGPPGFGGRPGCRESARRTSSHGTRRRGRALSRGST